MIETLPKKGHPVIKLLLIAAAIYAFHNREKISHGLSDFLAKNQTIQEAKRSVKWAYDELRPPTEAEKRQHEAYAKRQREAANDLRKHGINPYVQYAEEGTPEYKEAAEFIGKLKRGEVR